MRALMFQQGKKTDAKFRRKHCRRNQGWDKIKESRLPIEDEIEMIRRYQKDHNVLELRPIIHYQMLPIKKLAQQYTKQAGQSAIFNNLVTVGILGVITSLQAYQPTAGARLGSHTELYIKRAMAKEINRYRSTGKPRAMSRLTQGLRLRMCFNCHRRCLY